jgi:hypothetical protein
MEIAELEARIRELENKVRTLEDTEEIKKLQRAYGFYLEHWMVQEVVDLFADNPGTALYWLDDTWLGKTGVRRFFQSTGVAQEPTFTHQLMQLSGIVHVAPDGRSAKGRWYGFGGFDIKRNGVPENSLTSGIYEMEYIKEDGVWKILTVKYAQPFLVKISEGWQTPEERRTIHDVNSLTPDIRLTADPRWVSGYIFPFHYRHPVTGKVTTEDAHNARLRQPG